MFRAGPAGTKAGLPGTKAVPWHPGRPRITVIRPQKALPSRRFSVVRGEVSKWRERSQTSPFMLRRRSQNSGWVLRVVLQTLPGGEEGDNCSWLSEDLDALLHVLALAGNEFAGSMETPVTDEGDARGRHSHTI